MILVLLGPPGAGKGTQAKTLAKELKLPHISTGDILRQNVSSSTDLGMQAKDFMDKGLLVPDALVTKMLTQRFSQPDVRNGFILDGYPRNLNQAKTLEDILKQRKMFINIVVYLEASANVVIQRLSGRLVCKGCGTNFHATNMPPRVPMTCDNCRGQLYQRNDDKVETIKNRLTVYKNEVKELTMYYHKLKVLHRVNADEEASIVLHKIIQLAQQYDDPNKV